MKRWNSLIITGLFLLFLVGTAVAGLLLPDRKFSELENRYLKLQPDFRLHRMMNGLWMDDMEEYLSDQIAGRDLWIGLQGWSERLTGKKENNGVYFGKKDTLISRIEEPNEGLLIQNVDYVNSLAEQSGVPVSFGLIPTKAAIWADRLPDYAPTADEYAWIQKAYERSEVQNLDFFRILKAHREEPVYYRTDHHWTSLGALYGADMIQQALGFSGIKPEDYQPVQVSDSFCGTDWSSAAAVWTKPDSVERYVSDEGISVTVYPKGEAVKGTLYAENALQKNNQYEYFLGGNQPLAVVRSSHTDGPKIMLLRDSFSDCLVPFLTETFGEIHLFDLRYNHTSVTDYIRDNQIDQVAVIYGFQTFMTDPIHLQMDVARNNQRKEKA